MGNRVIEDRGAGVGSEVDGGLGSRGCRSGTRRRPEGGVRAWGNRVYNSDFSPAEKWSSLVVVSMGRAQGAVSGYTSPRFGGMRSGSKSLADGGLRTAGCVVGGPRVLSAPRDGRDKVGGFR